MKKIVLMAMAACLLMSSCGTIGLNQNALSTATTATTSSTSSTTSSLLGSLLSGATSGNSLTNILTSVIGLDKMTSSSIVGNWTYEQPGVAFTSENLLAKAGGEAVASTIKSKLSTYYSKLGITSSNCTLSINSDGTFTANIKGMPWSGQWTFDESNQKLKLAGTLLNITAYTKRNGTNGISILFEASKLLSLVQTLGKNSNNTVISGISTISNSYDGLRIGFDMK